MDDEKKDSMEESDAKESWGNDPVTEATPPLDERLDTLEAGEPPKPVVPADVPIEERVARLERIAEYLHDARQEAGVLVNSVDTLATATNTLTGLLTAVEEQQLYIQELSGRVEASEKGAKTRARYFKTILAAVLLVFLVGGIGTWVVLSVQDTQTRTLERLEAESVARGLANCEASNESSRGIRAFIEAVIAADGPPDASDLEVIRLAEEGFPLRDCSDLPGVEE